MTRINLVDPYILTDKHLMAEYHEIPRVFTAVLKLEGQGKSPGDIDIPEAYVLGQGHVKFFYNKIGWLRNRYTCLFYELSIRRFTLDVKLYQEICDSIDKIPRIWWNRYPYRPSPEEVYLNMARLCKRSKIQKVLDELATD